MTSFTVLSKLNNSTIRQTTLVESILIPEVQQALKDWINAGAYGVLIGGSACGFYTKPRATTDLDMIFLTSSDIPLSVEGFKRIRPHAFRHNQTHVEVEVATADTINIPQAIVAKVVETAIPNGGMKIASPSGLVAMKLFRLQRFDELDIVNLIATGNVDLTNWPLPDKQREAYDQIVESM